MILLFLFYVRKEMLYFDEFKGAVVETLSLRLVEISTSFLEDKNYPICFPGKTNLTDLLAGPEGESLGHYIVSGLVAETWLN